jgi:hypothetical protein
MNDPTNMHDQTHEGSGLSFKEAPTAKRPTTSGRPQIDGEAKKRANDSPEKFNEGSLQRCVWCAWHSNKAVGVAQNTSSTWQRSVCTATCTNTTLREKETPREPPPRRLKCKRSDVGPTPWKEMRKKRTTPMTRKERCSQITSATNLKNKMISFFLFCFPKIQKCNDHISTKSAETHNFKSKISNGTLLVSHLL